MGVQYVVLLVLISCAAMARLSEGGTPLFVFGDSTVDTGNQNYITSVIKSNYPPYGIDFVPPGPTGRFSNGKVANDFIADYLGVPFPVNYLSPEATGSTLLTGVNLASSGSGYLDITGQIFGVVNLAMQLVNFAVVKQKIAAQIGPAATENLIQSSVILISTGSNDFVNNYNLNPIIQEKYTKAQYQVLVLDAIAVNLKTLYNLGGRKVFIDSLGPVGCAPEQLNLYLSQDGKCIEWINGPLRDFNVGLLALVNQLRAQLPGYELNYVDVYTSILNDIQNPTAYGFQHGNDLACCGEGSYKGLPCLNPVSDVCPDRDNYVFWDLFHPSQKTHKQLADIVWGGDSTQVIPNNIQSVL